MAGHADRQAKHVIPGRTAESRPPTDAELLQIAVVEVPIETASVKTRTGGPIEEPEDRGLPVWAGVLPLGMQLGGPVPEPDVLADVPVPASLSRYARPGARGTDRW